MPAPYFIVPETLICFEDFSKSNCGGPELPGFFYDITVSCPQYSTGEVLWSWHWGTIQAQLCVFECIYSMWRCMHAFRCNYNSNFSLFKVHTTQITPLLNGVHQNSQTYYFLNFTPWSQFQCCHPMLLHISTMFSQLHMLYTSLLLAFTSYNCTVVFITLLVPVFTRQTFINCWLICCF